MEVASKRARAGGVSALDWLSALPDDLLCHVLSFIPSRQAVQTAILSKRWVDLWRSVPAIDLDIRDFGSTDKCSFGDFATNLLMFHNAQFLDAFRLCLSSIRSRCFSYPGPNINRWIKRVIKHHPLVMDINVCSSFKAEFRIPLVGSAFSNLKKLKLNGISSDNCFTEGLISGCPVLEDLTLDYCRDEFDAIQSDTLKNLVVKNCSTGNSLARASISAYSNELSEMGQIILLGSLFNVTSLELEGFSAMAFLDKELDRFPIFDNLRILSLNWCFHSQRDVHKFKALGRFLQKTPNLDKFTLQDFWYFEGTERKVRWNDEPRLETVRPVVGPNEFPMLKNLRTLFLDKCDLRDNFRILCHFLQKSPNLEKLIVRCCELPASSAEGKRKAKSGKTYSRFQNLVRCKCHKLKSTEIIYEKGGKVHELVTFLLDISHSAPENTITLNKE